MRSAYDFDDHGLLGALDLDALNDAGGGLDDGALDEHRLDAPFASLHAECGNQRAAFRDSGRRTRADTAGGAWLGSRVGLLGPTGAAGEGE